MEQLAEDKGVTFSVPVMDSEVQSSPYEGTNSS